MNIMLKNKYFLIVFIVISFSAIAEKENALNSCDKETIYSALYFFDKDFHQDYKKHYQIEKDPSPYNRFNYQKFNYRHVFAYDNFYVQHNESYWYCALELRAVQTFKDDYQVYFDQLNSEQKEQVTKWCEIAQNRNEEHKNNDEQLYQDFVSNPNLFNGLITFPPQHYYSIDEGQRCIIKYRSILQLMDNFM